MGKQKNSAKQLSPAVGMSVEERLSHDKKFSTVWRKHKYKYMMIAPFAFIFIVFTFLPVVISMILSLTSFDMVEAPEFIGFSNYVKLIVYDPIFLTAVKNTLVFAIITGPVSYIMCFCLCGWSMICRASRARL